MQIEEIEQLEKVRQLIVGMDKWLRAIVIERCHFKEKVSSVSANSLEEAIKIIDNLLV